MWSTSTLLKSWHCSHACCVSILLLLHMKSFNWATSWSRWTFVSSEHAWTCLCPFSRLCDQKNASWCAPQWSPSSAASVWLYASSASKLEYAAMFRKFFLLMLTLVFLKVEVVDGLMHMLVRRLCLMLMSQKTRSRQDQHFANETRSSILDSCFLNGGAYEFFLRVFLRF